MRRNLSAFVAAFIFAMGLGLGGMTDPAKIIAFLDFTGDWDPAMILVMGGAVMTYGIGYRLVVRRSEPLLQGHFALPKPQPVDLRLMAGAAIFGVGWGLGGLCPGPAVVSLANASLGVLVFVGAMLIGLRVVPRPGSQSPAVRAEPARAESSSAPEPEPSAQS